MISFLTPATSFSVMYSITTFCRVKPSSTLSMRDLFFKPDKASKSSETAGWGIISSRKSAQETGSRLIANQYIIPCSHCPKRLNWLSNNSTISLKIAVSCAKKLVILPPNTSLMKVATILMAKGLPL